MKNNNNQAGPLLGGALGGLLYTFVFSSRFVSFKLRCISKYNDFQNTMICLQTLTFQGKAQLQQMSMTVEKCDDELYSCERVFERIYSCELLKRQVTPKDLHVRDSVSETPM